MFNCPKTYGKINQRQFKSINYFFENMSFPLTRTLFPMIHPAMAHYINRTLSLLIYFYYIYIVYASDQDIGGTVKVAAWLLLPMACIWFSDAMGQYTGMFLPYSRKSITAESPAGCVLFLGWIILIIPLLIAITVSI